MGLLLSLIVVLSGILRVPFLNTVPPELFGDELDVGYQAYSFLHTGKDLYNQTLPLMIHSLSEWRLPLIVYQMIPTIKLFGLNEWGVRLPEAIFGTLAPLILYLLVFRLTRSAPLSLCSSVTLAIIPWHIMYSRMAAFGVVTLIDLVMLGTLLFLRRRYVLSGLFFALTLFTYSTALIFTPLLILVLLISTRIKPKLSFSVIFLGSIILYLGSIFFGHSGDRFGTLSIFKSQEITAKIINLRNDVPSKLEPLFHNKPESVIRLFTDNYVRAFSTDFLFVRGDPVGRHSIQVMGQLLPITAPFLVLGLYYLATRRHYFWLAWLALAPIPSALTIDGAFHATRLFLMTVPLSVAIGSGLFVILTKSKLLSAISYVLMTISFIWFAHFYFIHYPRLYSRWWQVGFKSALTRLVQHAPSYDRVFINNTYEPSLIRFLFYTQYPPDRFHRLFTLDQPQKNILPGYDGFTLDGKYFFGSFSKPDHRIDSGNLYMLNQRDDGLPQDGTTLFISSDPLGTPIFYLVTKK